MSSSCSKRIGDSSRLSLDLPCVWLASSQVASARSPPGVKSPTHALTAEAYPKIYTVFVAKYLKEARVNLRIAGTKSELDVRSSSSNPITTAATYRVNSVDLLRGVVMMIMLLDHTREFVHRDVLNFDATDLTRTNVLLFFTRWITHFCAPVFVFLAGTGAFLQTTRGKSKAELSKFLVKRGLWLALLEFTLIRVVVWFNLDYHFALELQVIWVIGVSMVILAALIHLPLRLITTGSVALIALHNLFDVVRVDPMPKPGFWAFVWMVLHQPG